MMQSPSTWRKGAKYQSFKTKWAAEEALRVGPESFQDIRQQYYLILLIIALLWMLQWQSRSREYQGVYTGTKTAVFHKLIDGVGTNRVNF